MGPAQNTRTAASSSSMPACAVKSASPSALSSAPPSSAPMSSAPAPINYYYSQPSLSSDVPQLNRQGTNWATFLNRIEKSMQTSRPKRWGYLDGTNTRPIPTDPDNPSTQELLEASQWDDEDDIAAHL